MTARSLLVAVALVAASSTASVARDLTVVTRSDSFEAGVRQVFVHPFTAATEIPVVQESWEGGVDTLRARVKVPEAPWDLVQVDPDELATGCNEGLFEKLEWPAIGGRDHYMSQAVSECGLGANMANLVLAWDRDKFPATPTWADFWDVAKYPGKRGLAKNVRGNLEIALLADGVAPADVYKTLGSNEGVDRAFRKLDQLKPYLVWWQTEADATHILGSGDVLMTSAPSGRVVMANRQGRNFGVQWAASLYEVQSWAIVKGSPNLRLAQQLLYFVGTPAIEARLLRISGDAGFARGVNDGLSTDMLALSPTNPTNLSAGLRSDTGFWHENLAKLRQRFDTWMQGH